VSGSSRSGAAATREQYSSASVRPPHAGKRVRSRKARHVRASSGRLRRDEGDGPATMRNGSKGSVDGVASALRDCVMESSIEERDVRRKSAAVSIRERERVCVCVFVFADLRVCSERSKSEA